MQILHNPPLIEPHLVVSLKPIAPEEFTTLNGENQKKPKKTGDANVIIGKLDSWSLMDKYLVAPVTLPPNIRTEVEHFNFCLVRLPFSIEPSSSSIIDTLKLTLTLQNQEESEDILVYDMFPNVLEKPRATAFKIGVTPDYRFSRFESEISRSEICIQYEHLTTKIIASGHATSRVSWWLKDPNGVFGNQYVYAIVKWPRTITTLNLYLEIAANLAYSGYRFWKFKTPSNFATYDIQTVCHPVGVLGTLDEQHDIQLTINPSALATLMEKSFDLSELQQLCFHLGINYENIPGKTLAIKVIELIKYFLRRNKYKKLVDYVQGQRPNAF